MSEMSGFQSRDASTEVTRSLVLKKAKKQRKLRIKNKNYGESRLVVVELEQPKLDARQSFKFDSPSPYAATNENTLYKDQWPKKFSMDNRLDSALQVGKASMGVQTCEPNEPSD